MLMINATDDRHHSYECIALRVDNLLIATKTPETIVSMLQDEYKFKLKGDF